MNKSIELLRTAEPKLIKKAISQALNGDVPTLRLLLDKVIPQWLGTRSSKSWKNAKELRNAAMKGDVSIEEAKALFELAKSYLEIKEYKQLEERIMELEKKKK